MYGWDLRAGPWTLISLLDVGQAEDRRRRWWWLMLMMMTIFVTKTTLSWRLGGWVGTWCYFWCLQTISKKSSKLACFFAKQTNFSKMSCLHCESGNRTDLLTHLEPVFIPKIFLTQKENLIIFLLSNSYRFLGWLQQH